MPCFLFSRNVKMKITRFTPLIPIILCVIILLWIIHLHEVEPTVESLNNVQVVKEYCYDNGYSRSVGTIVNSQRSYYCMKFDKGSTVVHKIPENVYINIANH